MQFDSDSEYLPDTRAAAAHDQPAGHRLLLHWRGIGDYLGVKPHAARYLSVSAGLPIFYPSPGSVASTVAMIDAWMAERMKTVTTAQSPNPTPVEHVSAL